MATFAFKLYTYVPTASRSRSTATRYKPTPERVSILNKLQQIRSSSASLSMLRLAVAVAADNDGGYRSGIQGTGTVYGRSDKTNDDENDDDRDLPTIEELRPAKLQEQGFATEDRGPDKTPAQSDNSDRNSEDPIALQGDGDSSASGAIVDDVSLRAESIATLGVGLFDSLETAIDSITLAPRSSDGRHDINDYPETAPHSQLAEQRASTSNSVHPHTPSSRLSSDDSIGAVDLHPRRARSEATTSCSTHPQSPPPRCARASLENQLSQEGHLYTARGVADEHELIDY